MAQDAAPSAVPVAATDWEEYSPAPGRTAQRLRIAGPRSRWRGSPGPDALTRSAAHFRGRPAPRADRCRQHAGAGAEAEHAARTPGFQHMIEQQQAAACGAVVAGAERQRRLDFDAEL